MLTSGGCWSWWAPGWEPVSFQSPSALCWGSSSSQQQISCPAEPNLRWCTCSDNTASSHIFLIWQFIHKPKEEANLLKLIMIKYHELVITYMWIVQTYTTYLKGFCFLLDLQTLQVWSHGAGGVCSPHPILPVLPATQIQDKWRTQQTPSRCRNQVLVSKLHLELLVSPQKNIGLVSGGEIICWPGVRVHSRGEGRSMQWLQDGNARAQTGQSKWSGFHGYHLAWGWQMKLKLLSD